MTETALGPYLTGLTNMASHSDSSEMIRAMIERAQAEGSWLGRGRHCVIRGEIGKHRKF